MKNFRAMKAVYCYLFPEVREVLHEVERAVPDGCYLVTEPAASVGEALAGLYARPLEIPATPAGAVDLDAIHEPVIDRIVDLYAPHAPGLEGFPWRYPTSGSSEGIFHLLVRLRTAGTPWIYVLDGEYEGYEAQAANIGLAVRKVDPGTADIRSLEPGVWFVSNPSARDGNVLPQSILAGLASGGHRLVLDLAYLGATAPRPFPVGGGHVDAVVMSFSKPYGVFRSRIGGFAFCREEVPSLYGNKWFKDVLRLLQALALAERLGPPALWERYRPVQERIVAEVNREFGLGLRASDALLIAHLSREEARRLTAEGREMIAPYARGGGYRFCLTPWFEEIERRSGKGRREPAPR